MRGVPTKTHPVVAQSAQEMLNKADNEKSGVISTAMSFLSLYRDPVVAENVSTSDFRITDLMGDAKGEKIAPTSLYLVVPPSDKDRLKPLIRLILNQVVRRLTESMEFKGGRSVDGFQHRLLLMIDEFPSLGKLDIFAESLAYVAGYGMKMYLICQDTAQLYAAYGKDESIIANCHVRVVYAPNRVETAEWLSKILGKKTLVTENTTFSYNGQFLPYQTGMSGGLQYQGRELLTTEEVMSLRGPTKDARGNIVVPGAMITLVAGKAPVYGTQMLYFKDPVFLARAQIPPPDGAAPVEKGDSTAPVVSADAAVDAREHALTALAQDLQKEGQTVENAPAQAAPQKLDLDALDALEALDSAEAEVSTPHTPESALPMELAGPDDQARAQNEAADLAHVLDLLSANTEVSLREKTTDADNRNRNPEINDYGDVDLVVTEQMPPEIPEQTPLPSRTREHRALDKRGFAMILGVE
jgi:type IV secretion system protein VirD4